MGLRGLAGKTPLQRGIPLIGDVSRTNVSRSASSRPPHEVGMRSRGETGRTVQRFVATQTLEMPVPSQVVCVKTINNEKRLNAVAQKIALQINVRLYNGFCISTL